MLDYYIFSAIGIKNKNENRINNCRITDNIKYIYDFCLVRTFKNEECRNR